MTTDYYKEKIDGVIKYYLKNGNGGKNLQKCQLDFAVAFEFRNNVHSYASRLFFDEIIKKNVLAFLSQAELRYGRESIPRQRPIVYAKQ